MVRCPQWPKWIANEAPVVVPVVVVLADLEVVAMDALVKDRLLVVVLAVAMEIVVIVATTANVIAEAMVTVAVVLEAMVIVVAIAVAALDSVARWVLAVLAVLTEVQVAHVVKVDLGSVPPSAVGSR